jgi:hypothetical protein
MRQADTKFTDMSPKGREVFRQAVASEVRLIRERGFLEFKDDGLTKRINVPVMPATMCAAFECPCIVVGRAVYCFDHVQAKRREEAAA